MATIVGQELVLTTCAPDCIDATITKEFSP
jgi:hypothetical protein